MQIEGCCEPATGSDRGSLQNIQTTVELAEKYHSDSNGNVMFFNLLHLFISLKWKY